MFHPKIPNFRPSVKVVFEGFRTRPRLSAIFSVQRIAEGFWLPSGLVAVPLHRSPSTARQRRRARRTALRQVLAALSGGPQP
ncbi:MAG: hypothetical protein A3F84_08130 [Candidatus Handelsmanbacteria bacterium RIFCSPLOWO2_12_FULL_64_10]|uniref:Uncharacterized protein n=1 Tax=Handelsmanbacteria sp. (strain RIFCSPLOWO2_12_FULL_64_10) TaxID=1817868 RepID=A0A1F6CPM5_HANXR|nr:MAG: hypothetical protein A3F84_08130 [Candidatus Handelsmanbacteria bacterium RIFCSPLOWO2_12_FULL_64_10]